MEIDNVPYIFGSFARRRHSQEDEKPKRRSVDISPHRLPSSFNLKKKESIDGVQRTRSLSKPFLELFQKKEEVKDIISEEIHRRKSAVRLALEDESPVFGQFPAFPKSIRKETGSLRSKSIFKTTFEETVQYFPKEEQNKEKEEFVCAWCKKIYTEPRVLNCLHSFCTKCLAEIENDEYNNVFEGKFYSIFRMILFLLYP